MGLKSDITRGEASLEQLNSRLGDKHPQVLEARASLNELRSKLDSETRRVLGGVTVSNTINRSRESQIRAELDAQRAKVLKLKAVRDEGTVLQRDVESAQRSYDAILQRFTQSSLEGQTTQSNVNVLTQATPPIEPASPRIVLNSLLSLVLGSILAISCALMLELRDRRVRILDDVTAALGLPVIGVMPSPGAKARSLGKNALSMQQRLLGPLPPAGKGA
jgi:uncharacterized protein involved in exopolysaccharide biosynthesis